MQDACSIGRSCDFAAGEDSSQRTDTSGCGGAGQGLNTAFEDVAVLARHLQDGGLTEESLRSFEKERIPRVSAIAIQEQVGCHTPTMSTSSCSCSDHSR